jgi:hypothetical protein
LKWELLVNPQGIASFFRLSVKELEPLTEVPSPVQISFEMGLQFNVIRQKSFL